MLISLSNLLGKFAHSFLFRVLRKKMWTAMKRVSLQRDKKLSQKSFGRAPGIIIKLHSIFL